MTDEKLKWIGRKVLELVLTETDDDPTDSLKVLTVVSSYLGSYLGLGAIQINCPDLEDTRKLDPTLN